MPQIRRIALLTLLAAVLVAAPSLGQTVIAGATPGGAFYTIAVPDAWNGGLVIYNHGFTLTPGTPGPDLGPLVGLQILEGYAVAASSYRLTGWAVFDTVEDLEELYGVFVANFGTPAETIVYGPSLGGIVTVQAVEQANLGNITGAMPFCGALGGSRNFNGALDARLIYDFLCLAVPGAAIPGAAQGLPAGSTLTPVDTVTAINNCFGHLLPPALRTPGQQTRLNRFLNLTGIPPEFIDTTVGFFVTFALADLVHDPNKLGGMIGFGNKNVDYGAADVNAGIQRVVPRKTKRKQLEMNYTPSGNVGNTKVLSMHTSGDGLVFVEHEAMYAAVAPPDLFRFAVAQEATPTHCGFTTPELVAGWETLRGWIAGDPPPSALTLQVMCGALQGAFPGPCRYNPFFVLPNPDVRFRPRQPGNAIRGKAEAVVAPAASETPGTGTPVMERPAAPAPEVTPDLPEKAPAPKVQSAPFEPRASRPDSEEPVSAAQDRLSKRLDRDER